MVQGENLRALHFFQVLICGVNNDNVCLNVYIIWRGERMSRYSEAQKKDIANKVVSAMQGGMSLHKSCAFVGINEVVFYRWIDSNPDLKERITRARDGLINKMAEEILELADAQPMIDNEGKVDNGWVNQTRLRIDARKWLLSKLCPKKYGDRLQVSGNSEDPINIRHTLDVSQLSTAALQEIMRAKDTALIGIESKNIEDATYTE